MNKLLFLLVLGLIAKIYGAAVQPEQTSSITKATDITIESAPYMAAVRSQGEHKCSGVVIHKKFVLTTAKCVDKNVFYEVCLETNDMNEGGSLSDVEFTVQNLEFDVALLKLIVPLDFGSKVDKIPYASADEPDLAKGTIVQTVGWAFNLANDTAPEKLQQVSIPIIDGAECKKQRSEQKLGDTNTERKICAGAKNIDACTKESGGPLIKDGVLVGITCHGSCDSEYGLYTKISAVREWIDKKIKSFGH